MELIIDLHPVLPMAWFRASVVRKSTTIEPDSGALIIKAADVEILKPRFS